MEGKGEQQTTKYSLRNVILFKGSNFNFNIYVSKQMIHHLQFVPET